MKTAETIFDILGAVKESEGLQAKTLADQLGLAQSTVYDHLSTLESLGFLAKRDREYHLSLKFLDYGIAARNDRELLDVARQPLRELAEDTGEAAWLYVEEHGIGVVIHKETGDHAVETVGRLGRRVPLHSTAAGKAILAHLTRDDVEAIVEQRGLPSLTAETITSLDRLNEEIDRVRERGYSLNQGEGNEGVHAVGAPILVDGDVLGAVSVSGPSTQLTDDRVTEILPQKVMNAAAQIQLKVRYP